MIKRPTKLTMRTVVLTAIALVAACTGGDLISLAPEPEQVNETPSTPPGIPEVQIPTPPSPEEAWGLPSMPLQGKGKLRRYEVMIRGENADAWTKVNVPVKEVRVSSGGYALPVEFTPTTVDLSRTDNAWNIGWVTIPDGVDDFQITVLFDRGGRYVRGDESGPLATAIAPIHFEASLKEWQARGHVVMHFDVERSFIPYKSRRILLPRMTVHF